ILTHLSLSRTPRPPRSPLSPYTTLFRSAAALAQKAQMIAAAKGAGAPAQKAAAATPAASKEPAPAQPSASKPAAEAGPRARVLRSEEHTSELQSQSNLVCRLLLEKKNKE